MTDPMESQLRRMMGRLSELAPMAPAPEELRARERPNRIARQRHLTWTLAAIVALVGGAVMLASIGDKRSTQVAAGGTGVGPIDVRLEGLIAFYIPEGFTLEDDRTESIPASVVPDPQASGRGVPQGSVGTMRTQRYNRGNAPGDRAVVYLTAVLRPDQVQTLPDLEAQVPNPQRTSVGAKEAVLSVPEQGASGLIQLRWVESPHVALMLTARGPVSLDEVRRMAEGVRFGGELSSAAPPGPRPGTASETPARAPGSVRVLVANGTATAGLAGRTQAPLLAAGYDAQRATDALRPSSTSAVHFRPGFDADARAVAGVLGIPETSIDPSPALVADPSDADVVVVLGEDFVNPVPSVSSPTAPTTTAPDTPAYRLQASAIRLDGFGPMFVGMPLDNAVRLYGQGGRIGQPPPCPYLAYTDGGATVLLTASSGDRFDLVTVRGGTFMTDAGGIRIGSSLADLTRAYGQVDLHGRMSSINGEPSSSGQMVYLPPTQPAYAIAFEVQQGVVVAIRAGSRDRVAAAEPC